MAPSVNVADKKLEDKRIIVADNRVGLAIIKIVRIKIVGIEFVLAMLRGLSTVGIRIVVDVLAEFGMNYFQREETKNYCIFFGILKSCSNWVKLMMETLPRLCWLSEQGSQAVADQTDLQHTNILASESTFHLY